MSKFFSLVTQLRKAATLAGRPTSALVWEMLRLRASLGRIGPSEYFDYRLYENDLAFEDKAAFGGWRTQKLLADILVDDDSSIFAHDKVTVYAMLAGFGFPIPQIRAVYGSARRSAPFACLESPEALREFLCNPANLPLYLKPAWGVYGRGNLAILGARDELLTLGDGKTIPVEALCRSLEQAIVPGGERSGTRGRPFGWILQEMLTPHADIARACGPKISGVRLHVFLSSRGPQLIRAIWKVNVGPDQDNFHHGGTGNMLAQVDLEQGVVRRVVAGIGFGQVINPPHPVTRHPLLGFRLPQWDAIKQVTLDAALNFPGFIVQGWDIAVCDSGPKLLEVNAVGDMDLSQHCYRRGFLDDRFLALMRDRDLEKLLRGPAASWEKSKVTGRQGRRKLHWQW